MQGQTLHSLVAAEHRGVTQLWNRLQKKITRADMKKFKIFHRGISLEFKFLQIMSFPSLQLSLVVTENTLDNVLDFNIA